MWRCVRYDKGISLLMCGPHSNREACLCIAPALLTVPRTRIIHFGRYMLWVHHLWRWRLKRHGESHPPWFVMRFVIVFYPTRQVVKVFLLPCCRKGIQLNRKLIKSLLPPIKKEDRNHHLL